MVFIAGRAIEQGMGQGIGRLVNTAIQAEIIYAFVIIICSLMIFFGTREIYKLSYQRGLKYFRLSFLFFALAYFFRSFIKIGLFYFGRDELMSFLPFFGPITISIFMYFSSMAIFYLLYSVAWKKWDYKWVIYVFHFVSVALAILIAFFGSQSLYLWINYLLFLFILVTVFISRKQSKKKSHKKSYSLYTIYLLLFGFWILNILDILIPNFLRTLQLFIYLFSIGVFLLILYKVLKRVN